MPSAAQLLVPALLLSNAVALYAAYTYRHSFAAVKEELDSWVHAKNDRREKKLKERSDKHERRSRNIALQQQRRAGHKHAAASPHDATASHDDAIEQDSDIEHEELPPPSATPLDRPLTPPPNDTLHAFHALSQPYRVVYNTDALLYLQHTPVLPGCPITSLPDVSETPFTLGQWKRWFIAAVASVVSRTPVDGLAIFYQTDVRSGGEWVSKSSLVIRGAEKAGGRMVWHKIVVQSSTGSVKGTKAAYAHLLCFSPKPLPRSIKAAFVGDGERADESQPYMESASSLTADILTSRGAMTWKSAMGLLACDFACTYIRRNTRHRCIVDPFCGQGSVLAVANAQGMDAVGVDTNKRRCRFARQLDVRGTDLAGKGEEEMKVENRKERRLRRKATKQATRAGLVQSKREDDAEDEADIDGGLFAEEEKAVT